MIDFLMVEESMKVVYDDEVYVLNLKYSTENDNVEIDIYIPTLDKYLSKMNIARKGTFRLSKSVLMTIFYKAILSKNKES